MNSTLNLSIVVMAFWFASAEPTYQNPPPAENVNVQLHEDCLYPTVMILSSDLMSSYGTGVIVKSEMVEANKYYNYVLTAAHVLFDEELSYLARVGKYENWSTYVGYDQFEIEVLYKDSEPSKDIALVRFTTTKPMSVAEIYEGPLYIGNEIFHIGCAYEPFRLEYGFITSVFESLDKASPWLANTYRISANVICGDSGGPVYYNNKLVAIVQALRYDQSVGSDEEGRLVYIADPIFFMGYAIPIQRFLECDEIAQYLD